jgi:high-affinity iron transporter
MVLISVAPITFLALLLGGAPPHQAVSRDSSDLAQARRLAATTALASQEYRLGIQDGRVVSKEEVEEAKLFLTEARRTAALLGPGLSGAATAEVDTLLQLVAQHAPPDSLGARVGRLSVWLAERMGGPLEDIPTEPPSLARGAAVYRTDCASCHGVLGRGDGSAGAGLSPPPAVLSDPLTLRDRSPLDFYRRITLGVAGTAMPAYEATLSPADRWAVASYASVLRLPAASGPVPPSLRPFGATAQLSDRAVLEALGVPPDVALAQAGSRIAAVRSYQVPHPASADVTLTFATVRAQLDSALDKARAGDFSAASGTAFDAYLTFERVEPELRAKNSALVSDLEASFATFRTRLAGGATQAELVGLRGQLGAGLENAERVIADRLSGVNLFVQSFVIMLREGLEAILIIGALMAFLLKTGAGQRRRDIHIGVGAAIGASLITALLLETLFEVTPAHREALEGLTMLLATGMLFYVSYWLLSKMEVAKWNKFVRGKVQDALSSGSALALASAAFLAVYREGFETVLFYKALFVTAGSGAASAPIVTGILLGSLVLVVIYQAINRFGMRIPLRPFFAVTSGFLYYMAFVFAGKGVAELQEGGLLPTTILGWAPRVPALGIYPTLESLALQLVLLVLLGGALVWTFVVEPRRLRVTSSLMPEQRQPASAPGERVTPLDADLDLLRSLERMDADLAELRAEIERLRARLTASKPAPRS